MKTILLITLLGLNVEPPRMTKVYTTREGADCRASCYHSCRGTREPERCRYLCQQTCPN